MVNAPLTISENQPIGTVVGEFNATDPDVNATLTYHLISGVGDGNNSLFTIDQNGTVKTATVFDFETNASTYSIRIQARDEFNATVEGNFTVVLTDVLEDIDGDGLADHLEQVGSTQYESAHRLMVKAVLFLRKVLFNGIMFFMQNRDSIIVRITQPRLMEISIGCLNGITIYLTNLTKLMLICAELFRYSQ
jgi:hypothetical protein